MVCENFNKLLKVHVLFTIIQKNIEKEILKTVISKNEVLNYMKKEVKTVKTIKIGKEKKVPVVTDEDRKNIQNLMDVTKTPKELRETRLQYLEKILVEDYIDIMKAHTVEVKNKLENDYSLGEAAVNKFFRDHLSPMEQRMVNYRVLLDEREGMDVSEKELKLLEKNMTFQRHDYGSFDRSIDLVNAGLSFALTLLPISTVLDKYIANNFYNIVYLPLRTEMQQKSEFYTLKFYDETKKRNYWRYDKHLSFVSQELSNFIVNSCRYKFQIYYESVFRDTTYRDHFLKLPYTVLQRDILMILKNLRIACNPRKLGEILKEGIYKKGLPKRITYKDKFFLRTLDSEYEDPENHNDYVLLHETIDSLFMRITRDEVRELASFVKTQR